MITLHAEDGTPIHYSARHIVQVFGYEGRTYVQTTIVGGYVKEMVPQVRALIGEALR